MSERRPEHFNQLRDLAMSYPVSLLDVENAFYNLTAIVLDTPPPVEPEKALAMMPAILKQSVTLLRRPALIAADIRRCL